MVVIPAQAGIQRINAVKLQLVGFMTTVLYRQGKDGYGSMTLVHWVPAQGRDEGDRKN